MTSSQERKSLAYLGIIVGSVSAVLLAAFVSVRWHLVIGFRWITLAVVTGILIWVLVQQHKRYWTRPALWLTIVGATGVHLAIFVPILRADPDFRLLWWLPIGMVEAAFFTIVCDLLLTRPEKRHRSHGGWSTQPKPTLPRPHRIAAKANLLREAEGAGPIAAASNGSEFSSHSQN